MNVTGAITELQPKSITAKTGKRYTVYTAMIGGTPVSIGFNKPKFMVGQVVSLEANPNKYGDFEYVEGSHKTVDTSGSGGAAAGVPSPARSSAGGSPVSSYSSKPFPVPYNHGDMSIIRQSALKAAIDTVCQVDTPKGITATELGELAIELAYKYAEFSSGRREERIAKEMVESGTKLTTELKDNVK